MKPELKELRHRLESMAASKLQDWVTLNKAERAYLLALLDAQKAEPGSGEREEDDEVVLHGLELAISNGVANPEVFNESFVYLRRRLSRPVPAPASVTREQLESAVKTYHITGPHAPFILEEDIPRFLYRLGVRVED